LADQILLLVAVVIKKAPVCWAHLLQFMIHCILM